LLLYCLWVHGGLCLHDTFGILANLLVRMPRKATKWVSHTSCGQKAYR
jgi:hypothetical protein